MINMALFDNSFLLLMIPTIVIIITVSHFLKFTKKSKLSLPPGPKPWPIIGNIHQLGDKPHEYVANISKIFGPIMSLKLGNITTIVISSPELAKEIFLKHDLDLSSRKVPFARRVMDHDRFSMIWLPACQKWRTLRKVMTMQLFTKHKLDSSQGLREMKVRELVDYARDCCNAGLPVDIGNVGFTTLLNMMSNTLFSCDLGSHNSSSSSNNANEFKDLVWNLLDEGSKLNVVDFFPLFELFDVQRVSKRNTYYVNKMLGIMERIIDERLRTNGDLHHDSQSVAIDDVLDTLLKLVKDNELSLDDVKHLLMDSFLAGSDTTFGTLEWAMTELIHNPEKMIKAQNEIDQVLGKSNGSIIMESDVARLLYIQAVVKETLRLHPPAPILLPHKAAKDVELLCGYLVPKDALIWVNVWSIGRDSSLWSNPNSFLPERFIEGSAEIDMKRQDFKFIPFGAGRRMCPGMPLAYRMMHLMLANLLNSFNWKESEGKNVEVQETFGLSMQRVEPLRLIPIPRR